MRIHKAWSESEMSESVSERRVGHGSHRANVMRYTCGQSLELSDQVTNLGVHKLDSALSSRAQLVAILESVERHISNLESTLA
jgi:16S rRNA U1498 N3-methylase RsmE